MSATTPKGRPKSGAPQRVVTISAELFDLHFGQIEEGLNLMCQPPDDVDADLVAHRAGAIIALGLTGLKVRARRRTS